MQLKEAQGITTKWNATQVRPSKQHCNKQKLIYANLINDVSQSFQLFTRQVYLTSFSPEFSIENPFQEAV